jgi:cell division protein FtsW (lipid II flippase)
MGMVSGILPVVGVPLPLMSYGGTAMVTLGLGAGLLMSISRHRNDPTMGAQQTLTGRAPAGKTHVPTLKP